MGTFLNAVQSGVRTLPPRIVIQGGPGAGKTTLLANVDNIVVVPAEDGLGVLDFPTTPEPKSIEDLFNILEELHNDNHNFKAVGIDTIDSVETLIWKAVAASKQKNNIEEIGYGKGYKFADNYWLKLFGLCDALRRKNILVLMTAHTLTKNVDDALVGAHTRSIPHIHERATDMLYGWCDVMGYLFVERIAVDKGAEDSLRTTRTSQTTGQRILGLEDSGSYIAKNRYDLPSQIMIPKDQPFQVLRKAIREVITARTEASQKKQTGNQKPVIEPGTQEAAA